ncbi:hypothetical protein QYF36_008593 [Acer negundo]|nr:hypothetical protein QYF36_008593 [Acer negundo]
MNLKELTSFWLVLMSLELCEYLSDRTSSNAEVTWSQVKPGLPYLDIIRLLRDKSSLPIAAYQVSGEYSMIKAGGVLNMIDEERVMMESLMCLRRASADIILSSPSCYMFMW